MEKQYLHSCSGWRSGRLWNASLSSFSGYDCFLGERAQPTLTGPVIPEKSIFVCLRRVAISMLRFSRIDDISTSPDPLIGDESISSSEETELEPELTTGEESDFGAEEPG